MERKPFCEPVVSGGCGCELWVDVSPVQGAGRSVIPFGDLTNSRSKSLPLLRRFFSIVNCAKKVAKSLAGI